jgi:hypothetical protein
MPFMNIKKSLICADACGDVHMAASITIFLTIRDETGCWREVHSEELHSRYS